MKDLYPKERYPRSKNLMTMIKGISDKYGDKPLYKYIVENETVGEVSFKQFYNNVNSLGTALFAYGLNGSRIAILSESRHEWVTAYCAIISSGGVAVPLDKELLEEQHINFIKLAECEAVFCSEKYAERVRKHLDELPKIKYLVNMDNLSDLSVKCHKDYDFLIKKGKTLIQNGDKSFTSFVPDNEKMCALIFTSGTTGTSKGVMLCLRNLMECAYASANLSCIDDTDTLFSVLPLHHTYETCCGQIAAMSTGCTICFNNNLKYFMRNINIFKPTGIPLVPLFVTTMYKKIDEEIKSKNMQKKVDGGVKVTRALRKIGIDTRSLVFASVRKAFGGRLQKLVCGGAPIDPEVIQRFEDFGIMIDEGYGITECAPLVAVNPYNSIRRGSVGLPIQGSTVKILMTAEDGSLYEGFPREVGEICVKGNHVMLGYYNNPEATEAAFTPDGFFMTGDYGYKDEDGYIYITGRKKNIIILSNGKNVYPEEIEEYLSKIETIKECVVLGRKNSSDEIVITALVYPDYDAFTGKSEDEIKESIKTEVLKVNKKLPIFKQIRNIEIKKTEFEKNTTQKIMRYKIS